MLEIFIEQRTPTKFKLEIDALGWTTKKDDACLDEIKAIRAALKNELVYLDAIINKAEKFYKEFEK